MAEVGSGASRQQRRAATHAPAAAAPLCVEGGEFNMSNQQQQYDAVLHTFSDLLCSAMATADDTKSLEGASLATTRDLYEQRSAALPRLFSEEVLSAAHVQLRAAQAAQAEAAANRRQQAGGIRRTNVDIMNIGSQDDSAGDDDSIWWLASAPSLDLRNKTKPLSCMLTRSLNMSPAISAAFNLSLPVRAVCGRVDDLGVTTCGTSTVAGSVLTNKTSLTMLPRRILQNVSASYKSLVDSRLRSSLSALLKRTLSSTGTTCGDSAAALLRAQTVGLVSLMSRSDAVVVTAAVSSFKVIDVPGGSTDEGLDSTGHLRGRTVPLIFEAVLDVIVHDVKTTAVLQAPGSLTGQFVARPGSGSSPPSSSSSSSPGNQPAQDQQQEPRLARVELTVDAPHLLQMMMEEARKAVRKAVSTSAANIAAATTSTCNAANAASSTMKSTLNLAIASRGVNMVQNAMAVSSLEQAQKSAAILTAAVAAAAGDDGDQPSTPPPILPPQPSNEQRTSPLPRKVSDNLLRPGLKRKMPSSSSTTPKSKIILPKPKRRSSAFSSTGSITDEEGSVSSCISSTSLASGTSSAQQSSENFDTMMPPPRPRSPLAKSRSSSRLLFYSGRKSSTQDGISATTAVAATRPGRVASSKSVNQNASWDQADSRLSSSGSYSSSTSGSYSSSSGSSGNANANTGTAASFTAASSANASAATAAGFALLSMKKTSSPKNKTSPKQKSDANAVTVGTKRVRSDQSIPLKKRLVSHEG